MHSMAVDELSNKEMFEQELQECESASYKKIWEKNAPGRRNSQNKVTEVGAGEDGGLPVDYKLLETEGLSRLEEWAGFDQRKLMRS